MLKRAALAAILVVGCSKESEPPAQPRGLLGADGWTMHTIKNDLAGADGVALTQFDGAVHLAAAWEESGKVSVSSTSDHGASWSHAELTTGVAGVEGVSWGDVDGDGEQDVVMFCEACTKIRVILGPSWATKVTLTASAGKRWMTGVVADMDGDGQPEIVAGGKEGSTQAASVAIFKAGGTGPRDGAGWTITAVSPASWVMTLSTRDMDADSDQDILLTDLDRIDVPAINYNFMGDRWLEQTASGWVNHAVGPVLGGHRMSAPVDWDADGDVDVLSTRTAASGNESYVKINGGQGASWTTTAVGQPGGCGQIQAPQAIDFDKDGNLDVAFSYSLSSTASGVVAVRDGDSGCPTRWDRYEVSGDPGTKFDNLIAFDVDADGYDDIITTEGDEGLNAELGLIWYENPRGP